MQIDAPERPLEDEFGVIHRFGLAWGGVGKDLIFLTSRFPPHQLTENTILNCQGGHLTTS